jgi:hypothetical protein
VECSSFLNKDHNVYDWENILHNTRWVRQLQHRSRRCWRHTGYQNASPLYLFYGVYLSWSAGDMVGKNTFGGSNETTQRPGRRFDLKKRSPSDPGTLSIVKCLRGWVCRTPGSPCPPTPRALGLTGLILRSDRHYPTQDHGRRKFLRVHARSDPEMMIFFLKIWLVHGVREVVRCWGKVN